MSLIKVPVIPVQSQPVTEDRAGLPAILHRVYWLFLSGIQTTLNAITAAIGELQDRDYVYGGSSLTNDGKLTMVSATDGEIQESAITDNGAKVTSTEPVLIVTALTDGLEVKNTGAPGAASGGHLYGTVSQAPSAADQRIAALLFGGDDGTLRNSIGVEGFSSEAWTFGTAQGSYVDIKTTANGATARARRVRINTAGADVTGDANVSGFYKVAGTQVVGPRGAAITATAGAGNAAGVAYLQADAATWVTLMNNLRTRVSELEARLQAHGLIT